MIGSKCGQIVTTKPLSDIFKPGTTFFFFFFYLISFTVQDQ